MFFFFELWPYPFHLRFSFSFFRVLSHFESFSILSRLLFLFFAFFPDFDLFFVFSRLFCLFFWAFIFYMRVCWGRQLTANTAQHSVAQRNQPCTKQQHKLHESATTQAGWQSWREPSSWCDARRVLLAFSSKSHQIPTTTLFLRPLCLLQHVASGSFFWSMELSPSLCRQSACNIMDPYSRGTLCPLHSHLVILSLLRERSGRQKPFGERIALRYILCHPTHKRVSPWRAVARLRRRACP